MPIAPPPPATAAHAAPETAIVRQINRVRRQHGLGTLLINNRLGRMARRRSSTVLRLNLLAHTPLAACVRPRSGARLAETLAWVPASAGGGPRTVVSMWLQSPGHRAVLLDGRMRRVGVGKLRGALGDQPGYAVTADFSS
jgi:uncharacterized protein YkwD